MGGSLAQSFSAAASRNLAQSQAALEQYGETKYDYVRQVDAHSHWIGLAMLMIVLGVIFERVNFSEGIPATGCLISAGGQCAIPARCHSSNVSSWCSGLKSLGRDRIRPGHRGIGGHGLGICQPTYQRVGETGLAPAPPPGPLATSDAPRPLPTGTRSSSCLSQLL